MRDGGGFRKQLLLPTEHGSWSWFLLPYFVGVGVAGGFNVATILLLLGGMALFLLRQPASVWVRIRQGRGRKGDLSVVQTLTWGLMAIAFFSFLALLGLGLGELFILAIPLFALLIVYGVATVYGRTYIRTLWMELAGAAGLALMAPAAMIAATGTLPNDLWAVYGVLVALNVLGVLYVRLRIADTHERPFSRLPVLLSHILAMILFSLLTFLQIIPILTLLPFIGLLLRALWLYPRPRPIPNIKKFGFTEVGVEVATGIVIVLAYWG